ncbi:MAG TPA: hypothetical protein VGS41_09375, partial [Chthonomonadales bacterium]|nr:hypothetical protein [Chthonomonadales bacterium]
ALRSALPDVTYIDPAAGVAAELRAELDARGLLETGHERAGRTVIHHLTTTGDLAAFSSAAPCYLPGIDPLYSRAVWLGSRLSIPNR